jgi:hypothetical protein
MPATKGKLLMDKCPSKESRWLSGFPRSKRPYPGRPLRDAIRNRQYKEGNVIGEGHIEASDVGVSRFLVFIVLSTSRKRIAAS